MSELLKRFEINDIGRDYVVGDIHGCFYMLDALLARIGFDGARDRLFSVGDLIDRGPDSERAAEFLEAPWFHAIRGNHEQMMLEATNDAFPGPTRQLWELNGGGWFAALDETAQTDLVERVAVLPYGAEIALQDGETAALVHADVIADSWPSTRSLLADPTRADANTLSTLVWDRARANALEQALATGAAERVAVDGVDVIYFGHTPMHEAIACANTRWLDTGAFLGWRLSVAELGADGEVWSLAADLEECRAGWRTA